MIPPLTTSDAEAQRTCNHYWHVMERGWNCSLCGLYSFAPYPPDYGIPTAAVRTNDVQALRERAEKAEADVAGWRRTAEKLCDRAIAAEAQVAELTRERDAAIAQRDQLAKASWAVTTEWIDGEWSGRALDPLMAVLREATKSTLLLADTPIPDRLAAEREADKVEALNAALLLLPNRLAEAREALEDMAWQFAYPSEKDGRLVLSTGGLSALETAFAALGWPDPKPCPERECEAPDCHKEATTGTPTTNGYKRLCFEHYRALRDTPAAPVEGGDNA